MGTTASTTTPKTSKPLNDTEAWILAIACIIYGCVGLCIGVVIANKVGRTIPQRKTMYRGPQGGGGGGGYPMQSPPRMGNPNLQYYSNGPMSPRGMSPGRSGMY